jgi:choline transport protein
VTPENMNYAIAAFGVMLLIAGGTWIFDGRKNYTGPKLDVDGMLHGKVEGMDPSSGTEQMPEEISEKK